MSGMSEDEYRRWKQNVYDPHVEKYGERADSFETSSGMDVDPVYTPRHWSDDRYREDLGMPGEFPYTRGVQPNMYRGRFWTMRQYAGFGTAEESNRRYRYLLDQGNRGLSVAFDLPTQMGLDSDDPRAEGEVGRVGVAIDTMRDMEVLFEEIPLEDVSTSMTINAPAAVLLCFYVAVARDRGANLRKLRGTIQNDILKEYMARGTYIFPPEPSMRIVADLFEWCRREMPRWNPISISGYHIREAGSTAAQELAFTLADGIEYVEAGLNRGLDVDDFAPGLSFFFNVHNNFLEEIAKFRAARRMWARIMRERFGAGDPRSWQLKFHAQTGGSTLTAQQVENNVARVAIQALAAVLGGAQSLHTNSRDEALGLPSEEAVRTALRTQQILAHETGVADVVDPVGGSYVIESWTNRLEEVARDYLERIEGMGGMLEAIERGFPQRQIRQAAYQHQQAVESGQNVIVGVNRFRSENERQDIETLEFDPESEQRQLDRLRQVRERRDEHPLRERLNRLKQSALGGRNLVPPILAAAEARASIGEIVGTLKDVFGEYEPGGSR